MCKIPGVKQRFVFIETFPFDYLTKSYAQHGKTNGKTNSTGNDVICMSGLWEAVKRLWTH